MRLVPALLAAALMTGPAPAWASTFAPTKKTCPIGGEKFDYMALMSISTYGELPDGMPIGSGMFPILMPQCPGNGLVMYRDFDAATVKRLEPIIASPAYQALRKTETRYYLAYRLAAELGDDGATWLLLSATWEAKNAGAADQAHRYMEEFVARVAAMPTSATDLTSIALRARAANALRELGRFKEAEQVRAAIVIDPEAGGSGDDAVQNRKGWARYLAKLAAPIARGDTARAPIDMLGEREASFRCLEPSRKQNPGAALTAFETSYCARPEVAAAVQNLRRQVPDAFN
ncbi:MAG TPA: hypothetical protein VK980_09670 [Sphingomonas sp.]|nr:hypothetical protein [Sphingomonas sp.]